MAVGAVQGGTLHAVTRVDAGSGGEVRIEAQGAPEFFVDGERVQGAVLERALSAGSHVVSVPVKRDALPAVLKVTASSARFVAP